MDHDAPTPGATELTPSQCQRLLAWCRRHGLLGLLHHETLEVCFPPEWEAAGEGVPGRSRAHSWRRLGAGWSHDSVIYGAPGANDAMPLELLYGPPPRAPRPSGEQLAGKPRSMLETTGAAGGVVRRGSEGDLEIVSLPGAWRDYFPNRQEWQTPRWPLPDPNSEEFWREYGEPVEAILEAAARLSGVLRVMAMHSYRHASPTLEEREEMNHALAELATFTANTWMRAELDEKGKPRTRWTAPSLLGSLALMVMQDLDGKGAIRICERCATPFSSAAPQAIYCSDRCRKAVQQQRLREKRRQAGSAKSSR